MNRPEKRGYEIKTLLCQQQKEGGGPDDTHWLQTPAVTPILPNPRIHDQKQINNVHHHRHRKHDHSSHSTFFSRPASAGFLLCFLPLPLSLAAQPLPLPRVLPLLPPPQPIENAADLRGLPRVFVTPPVVPRKSPSHPPPFSAVPFCELRTARLFFSRFTRRQSHKRKRQPPIRPPRLASVASTTKKQTALVAVNNPSQGVTEHLLSLRSPSRAVRSAEKTTKLCIAVHTYVLCEIRLIGAFSRHTSPDTALPFLASASRPAYSHYK